VKILVGKTFGIGNAVLAVPMIKALASLGTVDVLVGAGPDDFGAYAVMAELLRQDVINDLHIGRVDGLREYDVAVMAIPFDGRWQNGVHFRAKRVLDCRKRPGNVERLGFDMWEKHEALYQMENAYELGYPAGLPVPDSSFMPPGVRCADVVYLGIGYKRDPGGFGLSKHFGNERFAALINEVCRLHPGASFITSGGVADWVQTIPAIIRALGQDWHKKFRYIHGDLEASFRNLSGCEAYVGNDTGMMHVAASCGLATYGITPYLDLTVKNPPFCERGRMVAAFNSAPEVIAADFVNFVWGDK